MSNRTSVVLLVCVALLLLGLLWIDPFATPSAPARSGTDSAATKQAVEPQALEKTPAALGSSDSLRAMFTSNLGTEPGKGQEGAPEMTPEWTRVLHHPDKKVRLEALERWAAQGAATPMDPLTEALADPDESVREKAQVLVEKAWVAKAKAEAK